MDINIKNNLKNLNNNIIANNISCNNISSNNINSILGDIKNLSSDILNSNRLNTNYIFTENIDVPK